MPKIYCVNNSGHNFKEAEKYGDEFIYLTEGQVNVFNVDRIKKEMEDKLGNFKEDDYLLLCGSAILCGIAMVIASQKHKIVNLLIYNAITADYMPRRLKN